MKKLLSIGLAAMLAFGLATTSFAASDANAAGSDNTTGSSTTTNYDDQETVTIKKAYKLVNAGTTSPAETFTLVQNKKEVLDGDAKEVPDLLAINGASFANSEATVEGKIENITITLPIYTQVGVYQYTLNETLGTTAGVNYYSDPIILKVTVIEQNGKVRVAAVHTESPVSTDKAKKKDTFTNTYSAGALNVSKKVEGNMGNTDKYFKFTVTLKAPEGKTVASTISVNETSYESNPAAIAIDTPTDFYLKDGETLSFTNVPYGVTYTVTETNGDYSTTVNGNEGVEATGTIERETTSAAYVNTKTGEVDTGVVLNNMPYILVLAVLAAGVAVFIIRKRRED